MSYRAWQDLLDDEVEEVGVSSDAGAVLAAPSHNARTEELDRLQATTEGDDALAALIAEQRAIESQVSMLGVPASDRPGRWGAKFQRPPVSADDRANHRNRARRETTERLERGLERARAAARERTPEVRRVPLFAERPVVGDAHWRLQARERGTRAWEHRQAALASQALEERLDSRPRSRAVSVDVRREPHTERSEPPQTHEQAYVPRERTLKRPKTKPVDTEAARWSFREQPPVRKPVQPSEPEHRVRHRRPPEDGLFRERERKRVTHRPKDYSDHRFSSDPPLRERQRKKPHDEPRCRGRSEREPHGRDRFDD